MTTPAALPVVRRKRGNPNWASGLSLVPPATGPTEFEMQIKKLELTPEMYAGSVELKHWCARNRNRVYIPEWLLRRWGISVDMNFSDCRPTTRVAE